MPGKIIEFTYKRKAAPLRIFENWKDENQPICVKKCSPSPLHTAGPPLSPWSNDQIGCFWKLSLSQMETETFSQSFPEQSWIGFSNPNILLNITSCPFKYLSPTWHWLYKTHPPDTRQSCHDRSRRRTCSRWSPKFCSWRNSRMIQAVGVLDLTWFHACTSSGVLWAQTPPGWKKGKQNLWKYAKDISAVVLWAVHWREGEKTLLLSRLTYLVPFRPLLYVSA